jgi:hypothetical protein
MPPMNRNKIIEALATLEAEGRKSYKPEYQAQIPAWSAIGKAVAGVTDSAKNVLDLAYTALEDHNYHDLCAVIEWALPLYGQVFHESDLQRLARRMNKKGVTVLTQWSNDRDDYDSKQVNVRIVIEDAPS